VFALLNKLVFVSLTSTIGRDKIIQLHIAENILSGKGVGLLKYSTENLNSPVLIPHVEFAPGYSFVMTPFIKIFEQNIYAAVAAFDIMVCVALLIVLRRICRLQDFPLYLINIFTFLFGCFQYLFFKLSPPSDAVSVLFIFSGICIILNMMRQGKKNSLLKLIAVSFVFFLPAFFRYMYLPVSIVLPSFIILVGYKRKNKLLIKQGVFLTAITSFLLLGFLLTLKIYTGNALPQYPVERGLFISNLTHWYPFIPASFFNIDFALQWLSHFTSLSYPKIFVLFEILNIVMTVALIIGLSKKIKTALRAASGSALFLLSSMIISVVTLLTLAYSSLTYSNQIGPMVFWTYINEQRYFAFLYLFTQLSFLSWLYHDRLILKNIFKKLLAFGGIALLVMACTHGLYNNAKAIFSFDKMKLAQNQDSHWRYVFHFADEMKKSNPGAELLIASTHPHFCHIAILAGGKGIYNAGSLNSSSIRVDKKSILLVIIPEEDKKEMSGFIKNHVADFITSIDGIAYYSQIIYP
jgi:hypothetical protein